MSFILKNKRVFNGGGMDIRNQQGVVLLIALILLVAMTMAGLAMMRTIGAGVGIAGNLAFKQTATSVADLGIETARNWLTDPLRTSDVIKSDSVADGYYSSWDLSFSPQSFDWANSKLVTANDGANNEVRVVIHRLCETAGLVPNDPLQKCATLTSAGALGSKGGGGYGSTVLTTTIQPYFRVTSRVKGPRNTTSYVQVVMY
jgi:type IV pilus assembly protein PilX